MKNKIRLIIDICMTLLLPLLMAYSLIGETFHEVVGTVIFVVFLVHHILNRKWYGALFKGKYSARRIFQTALNTLLLLVMILQPVSGILLSRHLYTFLPSLPVSSQARIIHMLLAYWGYVLMSIHAGTHFAAPLGKLKQKNRKANLLLLAILGGTSVYGGAAFVRRGFPGYMSGQTVFAFFDYGEPIAWFLLDYLAIMVLFMMAGYLITCALSQGSANLGGAEKQRRGNLDMHKVGPRAPGSGSFERDK